MTRRGAEHVIQSILNKISPISIKRAKSVNGRLYGGWFRKRMPTKMAQQLQNQVNHYFPQQRKVRGGSSPGYASVNVELARALACDPKVEFTHTFRPRSVPPNLDCMKMPFKNCAHPGDCKIGVIQDLFRYQECPAKKCNTPLSRVLRRPEQKLVDSMLVADLIHYGQDQREHIVAVSADDDLWPGIRAALLAGAHVSHLVPRWHKRRSFLYSKLATDTYSRFAI